MSGRSHTQGASNLGKRGRSKFWSILAVRSGIVEFHQILRLFNTEPNRPRASPAIFKHVGQVPYSRSFKFGEKGPIKILVHFGRQVRYGRISSNFKSFNTEPNRPTASPAIFKHVGQVPYSRGFKFASNLGKRGRSKFWSILAVRSGMVEFHQILSLSTQSLIGLRPRLQFLSM